MGKSKDKRETKKSSMGPSGRDSMETSDSERKIPPHLDLQRTHVVCGPDVNYNTNSTIAANQYDAFGINTAFSLEKFRKQLKIDVLRYEQDDMEFEIQGVSCAVANTLRRIMIAEVPTMAIEHVFIVNNTSIIQDEVLAHRLGLIPIAVDPRLFSFRTETDRATEHNTIVLKLKIECRRLPDGTLENDKVHSKELHWLPEGSEMPEETDVRFENSQLNVIKDAKAVHSDILIAKLQPGQCIELEAHCIKGVGEDHAKWSPVATTWYRLFPEVVFLQQPPPELGAKLLAELPGLVRRDPNDNNKFILDEAIKHDQKLEKVRRMSGEDLWAPYIQLRKRKDRFIFTIESTGALRPHEIFAEAVTRIVAKCDKVLEGLARFDESSFDYS